MTKQQAIDWAINRSNCIGQLVWYVTKGKGENNYSVCSETHINRIKEKVETIYNTKDKQIEKKVI